MVGLLACWFAGPLAHAEDPAAPATTAADAPVATSAAPVDITPALGVPKKAKWDPKGKALDPYGRGDAKRKQEEWDAALPLLLEAVSAQPGCGKCLDSLAKALTGGKRYDDAVKVGNLMAQLYPERSEGWARVSDAYNEAQRYQEAVDATSKFLEVSKADSAMWSRRHRLLIQLAKFDEATSLLGTAEAAGVPKEDVTCLKVQLLAATGKPVDGREIWPVCDEGQNVDLRRYTEGWLALAEGDKELAAKRLVMAGADDFARLVISYIRIDQGKYDMAENLVGKVLEGNDWALDAQLAQAEALHGLGRDDAALKVLGQKLMADDWKAGQAAFTMQEMLLKPYGEGWPKQVGQRAATLKVAILAASGDTSGASALATDVRAVYGESEALTKALDATIGSTGIGRAQLQTAAATATPALKKCFDKEKKKTPTLAGQYVIGFTLGADGTVTGATTKSSTITAPDLEKCTLSELGKLKLPVAAGAQPASVVWTVAYPL